MLDVTHPPPRTPYLLVGVSHGTGLGEGGHVEVFVAEGGAVEHASLVVAVRGLDDDEALAGGGSGRGHPFHLQQHIYCSSWGQKGSWNGKVGPCDGPQ